MARSVGSVERPSDEGPQVGFRAVVYTDIDGSTGLWERHPDVMPGVLARHNRLVESVVAESGGMVVKNLGDGFLAVFDEPEAALAAATRIEDAIDHAEWGLAGDPFTVRVAIDLGEIERRDGDIAGPSVNRCARILEVARRGQILVSDDVAERAHADGLTFVDLGEFPLRGVEAPVGLHRVEPIELPARSPKPAFPDSVSPTGVRSTMRGFDLREQIGTGAAGVVYRAHQRSVDREVAIKLIRPEYANDRRFIRRFETEAQFIARLEHPHIVSLYDYWRDPDGAYLVMRWLRGGSLRHALTRGPWHIKPALTLLHQIGSALAYAHRHGVIHRDVRPSNVLLDEEGNGYLSDFGIASRPITATGISASTSPHYRSPEETEGRPLTEATDQYALALLAHELLTGHIPTTPFAIDKTIPPELATPLTRATNPNPATRYPTIEAFLTAIGSTSPDAAGVEVPVSRNPFKGLRPFFEADALDYRGRQALIDRLVDAVGRHRLVTVIGPSGSGKSSAVRAGLLPALRHGALPGSDQWLITDLYPGAHPFDELAPALLSVASQPHPDLVSELRHDPRALGRTVKQIVPEGGALVIVIDQFEELFTLCDQATQRAFVTSLVELASDPHARARIVVTLRADFYDRPLAFSEFAPLLEQGLISVSAPTRNELTAAIVEPSQAVGLTVEPALVEMILTEIVDRPGALPLLQYTLTELFDGRDGSRLTAELFATVGGVRGSLGRRAEAIFNALSPAARTASEQLFLRLVSVEDNTEDTRRRVTRADLGELAPAGPATEEVLDAFGTHRLLTFDHDPTTRDPTVELAHEAILRAWPRLAGWIDERRQDLVTQHHLATTVAEWEQSGRDRDHLLTGGRLAHFETWAHETDLTLTEPERTHLAQASLYENARVARRQRVRRLVTGGFAIMALIATLLAVSALGQQRRAEREERSAIARELAAAATANILADPELSMLLALEAIGTTRGVDGYVVREAEEALHESLATGRLVLAVDIPPWTTDLEFDGTGLLYNAGENEGRVIEMATGRVIGEIPPGRAVAISPAGDTVATGTQSGSIELRDPGSLDIEAILDGHTDRILDMEFTPDGARLATLAGDGTARLWDMASRQTVLEIPHECNEGCALLSHLDISPDGRFLGIAALGLPVVWDIVELEQIDAEYPMYSAALDLAFLPDGERLVTASFGTGTTHIFEIATGKELARFYDHKSSVMAVEVSPDGTTFATAGRDRKINIYSTASPVAHKVSTIPGLGQFLAYSPDGRLLAAAGARAEPGRIVVLDVSQEGLGELAAFQGVGDLVGLGFAPSGDIVAAGLPNGDVGLWRVSTAVLERRLPTPVPEGRDPLVAFAEFSPDGSLLIAGGVSYQLSDEEAAKYGGESGAWFSAVGWVRVWEVSSGRVVADPMPAHFGDFPADASFSADGSRVAVAAGGDVRVYDVARWVPVFDLGSLREDAWADAVGLSADGHLLATEFFGNPDEETLEVWNLDSGERSWGASASSNFWGTARFSPDGRSVLSAGMEAPEVWDAATGALLFETDGEAPARRASWSPDNSLIAAGVDDGSIHLWSATTGEEILTLRGHRSEVVEVEFSSDGSALAAIDNAGRILVWTLDLDRLIALAQSRLTRDLTEAECRTYLHGPCPER